jgi:hypothetical protein
MPSINLDLDYFEHPKTRRLIGLLGRGAEVIPIRVWRFCGKYYSETGVLTAVSTQEIESEAKWWGKPGEAVTALLECGFLHQEPDGTFIVHDWLDHSGHIAAYKKRAREAAKVRWENASSITTSNTVSNATTSSEYLEQNSPKKEDYELTPAGLADNWLHGKNHMRGRASREDEFLPTLTDFFDELLGQGVTGKTVLAAIRKKRDRAEYPWQFKKRLLGDAGNKFDESNSPKAMTDFECNHSVGSGEAMILNSDGTIAHARFCRNYKTNGCKECAAKAAEGFVPEGPQMVMVKK